MNIFYNDNGVGDVLMVQLTSEEPTYTTSKRINDVALIYKEETEQLIGFNLFQASTYVPVANGMKLTTAVLEEIQQALVKNEVNIELDADLTPKFVIGLVTKKEKHPNADKLNICTVDVGTEVLQIVCGAANVDENQKVVVAKVGAVMPSGMVIRDAELRGVPSSGMICSATELELPNAKPNTGILVVDTAEVIGKEFTK